MIWTLVIILAFVGIMFIYDYVISLDIRSEQTAPIDKMEYLYYGKITDTMYIKSMYFEDGSIAKVTIIPSKHSDDILVLIGDI